MSSELSDRIAKDLFTNGRGEEAKRLKLELPGGRDGGGWGLKPASGVIEHHVAPLENALRLMLEIFGPADEDELDGWGPGEIEAVEGARKVLLTT